MWPVAPARYTSTKNDDTLSDAVLWHGVEDDRVVCDLCAHRCTILPGKAGICKVRLNSGGILKTRVHNRLIAAHSDPIEKKPLFHFLPGTISFSIATVGCNFRCRFCQNWQISQHARQHEGVPGERTTPERVVEAARESGAASISYTYTEPTIFFETCEVVGLLARQAGMKNVFVSNGYMTPEAVERALPFLDGINVDLKGFDDGRYRRVCGATLSGVLTGIDALLKAGIWMEITTLVVPGVNDSDAELTAIARHIAGLKRSIPWHISRFHPDYRMDEGAPTSIETLVRAAQIGRAEGLEFVYLGNVPGHGTENTYCPKCATMIFERYGFRLTKRALDVNRCPNCRTPIPGVFTT
jgi:pyruvate formate lyase activating enzyme